MLSSNPTLVFFLSRCGFESLPLGIDHKCSREEVFHETCYSNALPASSLFLT